MLFIPEQRIRDIVVFVVLNLGSTTPVFGDETPYPDEVFFGDTHVHTNLSFDAYVQGENYRLGPEEAYRFAKGKPITAHNGMTAQLRRPLDFLVIADHAGNMGVATGLDANDARLLATKTGRKWARDLKKLHTMIEEDPTGAEALKSRIWGYAGWGKEIGSKGYRQSVWDRVTILADQENEPGTFTAFIGYEWSEHFRSLHRVVIFRDGAEKARRVLPFSQYDGMDPEELWRFLNAYEDNTEGEVLAIPHNPNMGRGAMFALEDGGGNPINKHYAEMRSRWEPILEVTQIKGTSEAHPILSPADEFADFEIFDRDSKTIGDAILESLSAIEQWKEKRGYRAFDSWIEKNQATGEPSWPYKYAYARSALKLGLDQQAKLGVNPFKFGLIGSTDAHTSLATADDDNFWGKNSTTEPYPERPIRSWHPARKVTKPAGWRLSASGYAAVWAYENTRESLFQAMKRREVYATTGPRMVVRFFGGWDYEPEDAAASDFAEIGYAKGVPMGTDLSTAPQGKAPRFLIRATKDPFGANLDRIQVIKGWRSADGALHEKIYDVALSDDREADENDEIPSVGNTVDVKEATYENSIGDPVLAVMWQDPKFDSDEYAFYYLRVIEIPTPRWPAFDAKIFKIHKLPEEARVIIQERAYTSPIWYSP